MLPTHQDESGGSGMKGQLRIEEIEQRIQEQAEEIVHLDQFVRLNFMAFAKLTQKFDQALQVSSGSIWYLRSSVAWLARAWSTSPTRPF